ncbi:3'-5' exonuclease [Anaerolineae bacterium CFX9]|nr:3'-5' exonuclease [Anaerolineae bacterium CFX9]
MDFWTVLRSQDYLILDTETTGLSQAEICQIAIIDAAGSVLLDTLVKPVRSIPPDATRIHGITDRDVAGAPSFAQVRPIIIDLLRDRDVIVYNAAFDRKMLHQSADAAGLEHVDYKQFSRWWCAMETFSELYAEFDRSRRSYRWQSLARAAAYYNIIPEAPAHSAIADCRTTLNVCRRMLAELGDDLDLH